MDVCVHKGIMFMYGNENPVSYMVRWAVCEWEVFVFIHEMNDGLFTIIMWKVCVQELNISCDQECIV